MTDYIIYRCILDYMLLLFGLWALASVITSAIFAEAKRSIDERRSGMYDRASDRNILGRCGGRDMPIHYRRVHRECPREVKCRAGQAPKQRVYSGIEYSRCESMQSLIKALNDVTKEDGMEVELLRREATEPIYLREHPENNVKEERQ